MIEIIKKYTNLYKATGGYVQYNKTKYYSQKWEKNNGKLEIKNKKIILKGNKQIIKLEDCKIATRTLGVIMIPSMKWNKQFDSMRERMYEAMVKLNSTVMKLQLVYLYFNTYLIKKVFFECGIIKLQK